MAGFGAKSQIHTAAIVELSMDLPLKVERVDRPEVVEQLLPQVSQIANSSLITMEEVAVCNMGLVAGPTHYTGR